MRVLMLGWEFPPYISGGLGTACYGLVKAMNYLRTQVLFLLPEAAGTDGLRAREWQNWGPAPAADPTVGGSPPGAGAADPLIIPVTGQWPSPYPGSTMGVGWLARGTAPPDLNAAPPLAPGLCILGTGAAGGYDGDLIGKTQEYAQRCVDLVRDERFDVIHAHDWITFPAGEAIAARSGRPLVVHVHATEFDRSGAQIHPGVFQTERCGMRCADRVIAVSHRTKETIVSRYGIAREKVTVVHNGVDLDRPTRGVPPKPCGAKVVLFLGRITMQKGPGYFLDAAQRVAAVAPEVRFVVAGWGDLAPWMIEQVAARGLGQRVFFAGFLHGPDVDRAFRLADVYVMPSVSEPFGLTALEAVRNGTPVIVSRTSGVAEVLHRGALKVDCWDTHRMASLILSVLRCLPVAATLRREGQAEIRALTWEAAARKCLNVYRQALARHAESMGGGAESGPHGRAGAVRQEAVLV